MADHKVQPKSNPKQLAEAALHSVSGGFMNTPGSITPEDIGIPLPNFELPPEIFDLPEITVPNIEGPNISLPNFQIQLPEEVLQQLQQLGVPAPLLQLLFPNYTPPGAPTETPTAPPAGEPLPPGVGTFAGGISAEHQDQAFLAGQAERMQGMDLNQLALDPATQERIDRVQDAVNRFYNSPNLETLLQDPGWRGHLDGLLQHLIDHIGHVGGDDQDRLSGADNKNDTLRGNAGDDTIMGGDGRDRIGGGAGSDVLYGDWEDDRPGGGADTIDGGIGDGAADIAHGGGGDDTYIWRTGDGDDQFHGGSGSDTLLIGGVGPNQLRDSLWLQEGVWLHSTDDRNFFFVNAQGERVPEVSGTLRIGDEVLTFTGLNTIRLP